MDHSNHGGLPAWSRGTTVSDSVAQIYGGVSCIIQLQIEALQVHGSFQQGETRPYAIFQPNIGLRCSRRAGVAAIGRSGGKSVNELLCRTGSASPLLCTLHDA